MSPNPGSMKDVGAKLAAAVEGKRKLIRLGKRRGHKTCPCGAPGKTMQIALVGHRNHMHVQCNACEFFMME